MTTVTLIVLAFVVVLVIISGWLLFRWMRRRTVTQPPTPTATAGQNKQVVYFCYISRNKIDQLYEQIESDAVNEVTEIRTSETSLKGEATAAWGIPHVLKLFKGEASYGRTGRIQREVKVKRSYLQKLRTVLLALAESQSIPPLSAQASVSHYYHYHGYFEVTEPLNDRSANAVVTITSNFRGRPLLLDCSLRNFTEGVLPDGSFSLNSANERFFHGDIALPLTTVFLLLEVTAERLVGTPLFLHISVPTTGMAPAL